MKLSKIFFIAVLLLSSVQMVSAQSVDELKSKIAEKSENIKQLEADIQAYQVQLETIGKEATSLKNTLAELDLSRKKLETNLALTQAKIDNTNLEIRELSTQIEDKSERISDGRRVIAQSLSSISQSDNISILETLLGSNTMAQVFNGAEELNILQANMTDRIHELQDIRSDLESNKQKTEKKKAELVSLQNDLANQKKILAETVRDKNNLLSATKNTESDYKRVLASKKAQKDAFEKELFAYESALQVAVDKSLIPNARKSLLAWPLTRIQITQYFGKTVAAQRLYTSGTHGGMDFGASIGTPVMAALSGRIKYVEPFARSGCQYGKFVLIEHPNGLSTLYGHLSLPSTAIGSEVKTGDVIGYSGSTGYATGPHLHFGVYATQGIRIVDAKDLGSTSCSGIKTVAAPPSAYLDPMLYL